MKIKNQHKNLKQKISKVLVTTSVVLNIMAINISAFAADTGVPDGVDTSSYNSLLDIIFWIVGILIAAAGCIPGFKAMAEGQANEDKRGFNSGLTAVITGAVCGVGCVAIRYILF